MLQQTQAATVAPRYEAFLARWPSVEALAEAEEREVLDAWAGLGYYRRARNLHRAARVVAGTWNGRFPGTVRALEALPGVGAYTAAAVAALAFGVRTVAVDGNVARVLARVFAIAEPAGRATRRLQAVGADLAPEALPGEFAEALIELGALVCRPREPRCGSCPWQGACEAFRTGRTADFPVAAPQKRPALRYSIAFRLTNRRGEVLLRRQSGPGPFQGMLVLPATPWGAARPSPAAVRAAAPPAPAWRRVAGLVEHGLTHLTLRTEIRDGATRRDPAPGEIWHPGGDDDRRLPAYTRKLLAHGTAPAAAAR
jgi:A/G-specific adenine glycosylase